MLTQETINIMKQFNENCEWLRTTKHLDTVELAENNTTEWINSKQALTIFNRSSTWLKGRMLKPEQVKQPINVNWFLIYGVDWAHEGKMVVFKKSSVLRLKTEMVNIGRDMRKALLN